MPLIALLLRDEPRLQNCLVNDAAHVVPERNSAVEIGAFSNTRSTL